MKRDSTAESGRQRWGCKPCNIRTTRPPKPGEEYDRDNLGFDPVKTKAYAKHVRQGLASGLYERVLVTSVQATTRLKKGAIETLKTYAKAKKAALCIMVTRTKNITLYTANQKYVVEYPKEATPYLITDELYVGGNVILCGDMRIPVTALNPLRGKEPIGGTRWTIYAHPQFAMLPVATPGGKLPKRMYTTGAISLRNYSQTDAGAKAKFHHVFGALVIEPIGNTHAFVRHLNFDNKGGFCDLDKYYIGRRVTAAPPALVLAPGDTHELWLTKKVRDVTYDNADSMLTVLRPKHLVQNDVIDGYAGSHHHENDPIKQFKKFHTGLNDYRKELDRVVKFLNEVTPKNCLLLIVESNHHEHLYKWLARVDPNKDHTNSQLIHELIALQQKDVLRGGDGDPFKLYVGPRLTCRFKFLSSRTSHVIGDVDYSQHGHLGVNGSRGSAGGLAKTSRKLAIFHAHGARIVRGVYQGGGSVTGLEYEKGMGDHTITHLAQYANGKRVLLDIIKGKYRK